MRVYEQKKTNVTVYEQFESLCEGKRKDKKQKKIEGKKLTALNKCECKRTVKIVM